VVIQDVESVRVVCEGDEVPEEIGGGVTVAVGSVEVSSGEELVVVGWEKRKDVEISAVSEVEVNTKVSE